MRQQQDELGLSGSRPPSGMGFHGSARKQKNYKKAGQSNVDETLFGTPRRLEEPGFSPPWTNRSQTSDTQSRPSSNTRPTSARGVLQKRLYQKIKFSPSYVDESLFGPPPVEPDFPAPWEKKEKQVKPILFDTSFTATRLTGLKSREPRSARSETGLNTHRGGNSSYRQESVVNTARPLSRQNSRQSINSPTKSYRPASATVKPPWK